MVLGKNSKQELHPVNLVYFNGFDGCVFNLVSYSIAANSRQGSI